MTLQFDGVSYDYRGHRALTDICFSCSEGITGLLGVNGAGKTTLLKLAVGELSPKHGVVRTEQKSPGAVVVGYCPQSVSLPRQLRVEEFFDYLAWLRRIPSRECQKAVSDALLWADLWERRKDKIGSLSGGMERRIAVAQALLGEPRVLLLDEPTSGLDPEQRSRIRALLKTLPGDVVTILSSHIVEDVSALCNETLVLHEGKLLRSLNQSETGRDGATLERLFLDTIVARN